MMGSNSGLLMALLGAVVVVHGVVLLHVLCEPARDRERPADDRLLAGDAAQSDARRSCRQPELEDGWWHRLRENLRRQTYHS